MAKKSGKADKQQNKKIKVGEKLNGKPVQEEVKKETTAEEEEEKEAVEEKKEPNVFENWKLNRANNNTSGGTGTTPPGGTGYRNHSEYALYRLALPVPKQRGGLKLVQDIFDFIF